MLRSTENSSKHSRIMLSLDQLLHVDNQQHLQRKSEFQELKHAVLKAVDKIEEIKRQRNDPLEPDWLKVRQERDLAIAESLKHISTNLDEILNFGRKLSTEHLILESLCDKSMTIRHEKIVDDHAKTFEWIYHDYSLDKESQKGTVFVDWLAHGAGIFWITGKAGSGKSTLMKYLSHHRTTERVLQSWSGQQELVVASFYFWYAGTEFQKSQEGLLKSLLYVILRQCLDSIPMAVPQRWERYSSGHLSSGDWSRSELVAALNNLTSGQSLARKFCFFIDGLDEYEGDHRDLINLIRGFTTSDDIKWCLSSRPWNVFELAFGNGSSPTFRLEDLTREDIRLYVRDELEDNNAFRHLRQKEGNHCGQLVQEFVQKAHGVFLWVFLVVRSLTSGLANADRLCDLQRRLRRFPDDLEGYFQHMLDTVDRNYQQQTAQLFRVALEASEPLTLMTYSMLDELETCHDFALHLEPTVMSGSLIKSRHDDMKLRINARSKDLLEVTRIINPQGYNRSGDRSSTIITEQLPPSFSDYQVDFLHRTVRDFFRIKHIHDWIGAHVSRDFHYDQSLCAAFLAQIKTIPRNPNTTFEYQTLLDLVISMAYYAHRFEARMEVPSTTLIDNLSAVARYNKFMETSIISTIFHGVDDLSQVVQEIAKTGMEQEQDVSLALLQHVPLAFAVYHDLRLYVAEKLDERWSHISLNQDDTVLLYAAMNPYRSSRDGISIPTCNHEMLCLLIDKAARFSWHENQLNFLQLAWSEVYHSWAEKAQNLSSVHTEQLNDSKAGLPQLPHILQWVLCVLSSLDHWRYRVMDFSWPFEPEFEKQFEESLTEIIEQVLRCGVNPNWKYGKCTPWTYFVACLYKDSLSKQVYATKSRRRVLRLAKEFLRHDAKLDQNMSVAIDELTRDKTDTDVPCNGSIQVDESELTAHDVLKRVLSDQECRELAPDMQGTAQSTSQRKEKQKQQKRRRKKRNVKKIAPVKKAEGT